MTPPVRRSTTAPVSSSLAIVAAGKGKATLTRVRRVGFVPVLPEKLTWRNAHAVGIVGTDAGEVVAALVVGELGVPTRQLRADRTIGRPES